MPLNFRSESISVGSYFMCKIGLECGGSGDWKLKVCGAGNAVERGFNNFFTIFGGNFLEMKKSKNIKIKSINLGLGFYKSPINLI